MLKFDNFADNKIQNFEPSPTLKCRPPFNYFSVSPSQPPPRLLQRGEATRNVQIYAITHSYRELSQPENQQSGTEETMQLSAPVVCNFCPRQASGQL